MIYGTGGPKAKLIKNGAETLQTVTLAIPTRRETEDFEEVWLTIGTDQFGQTIQELRGFRYHAKLVWTSDANNQSDMAQVQRVRNWRGLGLSIGWWPHVDQAFKVICEIAAGTGKPWEGKVQGEEITLELLGVDLLPHVPNPTLDQLAIVRGRCGILTTAWESI